MDDVQVSSKLAPTDTIRIDDKDQAEIKAMDSTIIGLKMKIADLSVQVELMTQQRQALTSQLLEVDRSLHNKINVMAKNYEVDESQKWSFDVSQMAYVKVVQQ